MAGGGMSSARIAAATDRCPRCGGAFRCGFADPAPCPCTALTLDAAMLAELRLRFRGCLCVACLTRLADGDVEVQDAFANAQLV